MLKVANSVINASRITGTLPVANGGTGVTTSTGTGNTVLSASPTLSGDVNFSTGNLVIGTAGKGIDFSIDPSAAGMTSELLNDYEVGTWTPTVTAQVGSITTVTGQAGNYTKIGSRVIIEFYFNITNAGTATVAIAVSNLPFVPNVSNINYYTSPTRIRTGGISVNSEWDSGDSKIYIYATPIASIYYGTMSYIV